MSESEESWADFYGYLVQPINLDAGVTMRTVGNGRVYMYKGMPGLYLDPKGNEVKDEIAKLAGFNIEAHRDQALLNKRLADAQNAILHESEQRMREVRQEHQQEYVPDGVNPFSTKVQYTSHNASGEPRGTEHYYMDHQGGGRWDILTKGEHDTIEEGLSKDAALDRLLVLEANHMAGNPAEPMPELPAD